MRSILITGATSGIGRALALLAADRGYKVFACGRNAEALNELTAHPNIFGLNFDVSNQQQTHHALSSLAPDISVLNAGVCEYVEVNNFDPALFQRVFAANVFGVINCVAALLPNLTADKKLVIVDSLARLLPFSKSQAYGASKAALHYFSNSLAVDLKYKGIAVQTVSPGFVETPLTDKNDFEMPMRMPVEKAAKSLLNGIESRSDSIYFPYVFALIMRVLGKFPLSLQRWLALKFKN